MLHATMKTFLGRRLSELSADQFSSTVLDDLLAVGIAKLQSYIHDVNPAALIDRNTFSTVAGTDLYAKQASALRVILIEMQSASGVYQKLTLANFYELMQVDEAVSFEDGVVRVADLGNKWFFRPTPDAVRTVRSWYVPIITTSAGWDAVATAIPPSLHTLPIDLALVEALGETAESASEARARIAENVGLIPMLYGKMPEQVSPLSLSPFSSAK
jgi:hypothetical protein